VSSAIIGEPHNNNTGGGFMSRYIAFLYGIISYAIFFVTFLYLIGFLANFLVPKSIDVGTLGPVGTALAIDIALIALFGIQHSVMARPGFKAAWTKLVPESVERSTYVLLSSVVLIVLYWLWRPVPTVVWEAQAPWLVGLLWGLFALGFGLVLVATFVINHFDLFGLRQVFLRLREKPYTDLPFQVRFLYRFVRHPLYVGWFLAFWATPRMTLGHLLFAIGMSAYILFAVRYEERDLVRHLGQAYVDYQKRVPKFVPRLTSVHEPVKARPMPAPHH
jgi:protein-S-isoprenylcysteine O-methyltransferase Ste14